MDWLFIKMRMTKCWLSITTGLFLLLFGCIVQASEFFQNPKAIALSGVGCNSVQWSQIPNYPTQFLGRYYRGATDCATSVSSNLTIILGQLNTQGTKIEKIADLIDFPAAIGDEDLIAAYDSDAMYDGREIWVSFECARRVSGESVGACMAPLNMISHKLDMKRSYVAVRGQFANINLTHRLSASVPKLLYDNGRAYLYWSAVKILRVDGTFEQITTRGIELAYSASAKRWEPLGHRIGIASDDPLTFEVFGTDNGDGLGVTSDSYDIRKIGTSYFLLGAVGTCGKPNEQKEGCYRPTIRKSDRPMGTHIFNADRVPDNLLPSNSASYLTFVDWGGKMNVMGYLGSGVTLLNKMPRGYYRWDLPKNSVFLGTGSQNYRDDPIFALINGTYNVVFGRDADDGGLANWSRASYHGASQNNLIQSFLNSKEGRIKYAFDQTPQVVVEFGFQYLLGRTADANSVDALSLNIVNQRLNRLETLLTLIHSKEFAQKHPDIYPLYSVAPTPGSLTTAFAAIDEAYAMILGRLPEEEGAAIFNNAILTQNLSLPNFVMSVFLSKEATKKYSLDQLNDMSFVALAYQVLLGRNADSIGLSHWMSVLAENPSRASVISTLIGSAEFKSMHPIFYP